MTSNPAQAHPVYVHLQRFLARRFIIRPRFGLRRIFHLAVHAAIPLTSAAGLPGSVLSFCSVAFRTADHIPILAQFFATPRSKAGKEVVKWLWGSLATAPQPTKNKV